MNVSSHHTTTGASMDTIVPKRHGKDLAKIAGAVAAVMAGGYFLWNSLPHGVQVPMSEVTIATVENGTFRDDITVRASAEPLNSVILDSVEAGRVEEVVVLDGAMVNKGQLLFRLSNAQRNLELLARKAEHAQQISNLANLRVAQEMSRTDHQRRLTDLEFSIEQGEKRHARNVKLATQGFISSVALDESSDALAQQRHALNQEKASREAEGKVRHDALSQMEGAIDGLKNGLVLVNATVEALAVRAPATGRLTGFRLQVGETVKTDQHIGRIDHPKLFKLSAQVDEYYLNRVTIGLHGNVRIGEKTYSVALSRIFPQIKEGRFTIELTFTDVHPTVLSPGQSTDAQITLGEPHRAMLLPNGAFATESGAAWVFVVGPDGSSVQRRAITAGRRNNLQIEIRSGLNVGEKVIISSYAAFGKAERLQLAR